MQQIKIYTLINPINGCLFYVGASHDPIKRLKGHSNRETVKEIRRRGLSPILTIVDEVPADIAGVREWDWIEKYRSIGYALENTYDRKCYPIPYILPEPAKDRPLEVTSDDPNATYRAHSPGYMKQLTFTRDLLESDKWEDFKVFCDIKLGKGWEYEMIKFNNEDVDSLGHYCLSDYSLQIFTKAA